jgi:hypothetical protein
MIKRRNALGFENIKVEEALILFESAINTNNGNKELAFKDVDLIDKMLGFHKLIIVCNASARRTRSGNIKKNSSMYYQMNDMLDNALNQRLYEDKQHDPTNQ